MTTQQDLAAPGRQPPAGCLSYEEFLDWCDGETRAEWVDGVIEVVSPNSLRHQQLTGLLYLLLRFWVEAKDLGEVVQENLLMRLTAPIQAARVPDILFVALQHLDRLRPTALEGPADLVVEVISPESIARDRGAKFVEYEQAGIPDYWLIDPEREQAEFYELGPDGRYRLALGGRNGHYRSRVLEGFTLELDWLWQDPLPRSVDLLRRLGLLPD
jgi:Uma2 family endonuclease